MMMSACAPQQAELDTPACSLAQRYATWFVPTQLALPVHCLPSSLSFIARMLLTYSTCLFSIPLASTRCALADSHPLGSVTVIVTSVAWGV